MNIKDLSKDMCCTFTAPPTTNKRLVISLAWEIDNGCPMDRCRELGWAIGTQLLGKEVSFQLVGEMYILRSVPSGTLRLTG